MPSLPRAPAALPRGASRWAAEGGQAIVEFALVAVLLLTLAFGGFDFARAFGAWAIVMHASREGARTASVQCTLVANCESRVSAAIEEGLLGLDVHDVRWSLDPGPYVSGGQVRVEVEYDLTPVIPLVAALFHGDRITVRGDTSMRLE